MWCILEFMLIETLAVNRDYLAPNNKIYLILEDIHIFNGYLNDYNCPSAIIKRNTQFTPTVSISQ